MVSGIWDWWPSNANEQYQFENEKVDKTLKKPSMDGNIQVIFLILAGGMMVALLVLMLELYKFAIALAKKIARFLSHILNIVI